MSVFDENDYNSNEGMLTSIWGIPFLVSIFDIENGISPGFKLLWGLEEDTTNDTIKTIITVNNGVMNRIVLGAIMAILAIMGDLVESSIKRKSQRKDSGNVLPGHGGILDRFDSSLLAILFYKAALDYYAAKSNDVTASEANERLGNDL